MIFTCSSKCIGNKDEKLDFQLFLERSSMENHQKEMNFISQSILISLFRGILVGIAAGLVVVAFRFAIEKLFNLVTWTYARVAQQPFYLLAILAFYLIVMLVNARFITKEPDIKGSGIPQVEAELKGLLHLSWWSVLWRKFVGGVLPIASGLMLGREGPSIQLGAVAGKGIAKWLKTSQMEKRSLIASGAAAGLAAAFNAPIAGLLFVVEEVYHHFSRLVWVTALVASITANFISLNIFGLTPVLQLPTNLPVPDLGHYWLYILLAIFVGGAGWVYEWAVLNVGKVYQKLGKLFHIAPAFYSGLALLAILPIGIYFPELMGGGHHLILELPEIFPSLGVLLLFLFIRFVWSMISYGSGLPGGIFLPILTLGSLLGMLAGRLAFDAGLISQAEASLFLVLGMTGFFAAISKAPLTAMILVTEMVGDLSQLMVMGLVAIVAFIVMDLLKGEPVYEAMLENLLPHRKEVNTDMTLIEVIVSEKIAGRAIKHLDLPAHSLITSQIHHGKSQIVNGDSVLHMGDRLFMAVQTEDIAAIREMLSDET